MQRCAQNEGVQVHVKKDPPSVVRKVRKGAKKEIKVVVRVRVVQVVGEKATVIAQMPKRSPKEACMDEHLPSILWSSCHDENRANGGYRIS